MSLIYSRMICQRGLNLSSFRSIHNSGARAISSTLTKFSGAPACESYDDKNTRLKRPLSPHLSIYKPQLTSMLSITHRTTGMILSGYGIILAGGTIFLPGGVDSMITSIDALCLPIPVLFFAKYVIALPATYHYFNGIRHLIWDLGQFLTIKQVYTTGYAVLALTVISALAVAAI